MICIKFKIKSLLQKEQVQLVSPLVYYKLPALKGIYFSRACTVFKHWTAWQTFVLQINQILGKTKPTPDHTVSCIECNCIAKEYPSIEVLSCSCI